jgi:hypothetical protein
MIKLPPETDNAQNVFILALVAVMMEPACLVLVDSTSLEATVYNLVLLDQFNQMEDVLAIVELLIMELALYLAQVVSYQFQDLVLNATHLV